MALLGVQELHATAEAILFAGRSAHSDVDGSVLLEERDAAESKNINSDLCSSNINKHGTTKTEKCDILCNFSDVCVIFNLSWTAVQCCRIGERPGVGPLCCSLYGNEPEFRTGVQCEAMRKVLNQSLGSGNREGATAWTHDKSFFKVLIFQLSC